MTKNKRKQQFAKFISREIVIEYKTCLYFSCMAAFYFSCLLIRNQFYAEILTMFEMILTAYAVGYLQVYILKSPDEAEAFGPKEAASVFLCSGLYTGASYLFDWYDRIPAATALFFLYCVCVYLCVYFCNRLKRRIDTGRLNRMLAEYKKNQGGKDEAGNRN